MMRTRINAKCSVVFEHQGLVNTMLHPTPAIMVGLHLYMLTSPKLILLKLCTVGYCSSTVSSVQETLVNSRSFKNPLLF